MSWSYVQKAAKGGSGTITSLALTVTGVAAGDLVCVSCSSNASGSPTYTFGDTKNTWTAGPSDTSTDGSSIHSFSYWSVITTGGTLTFTLGCSAGNVLAFGITEFSVVSGGTISYVTSNHGHGYVNVPSSGNLTFSGPGNFLLWGCESDVTSGANAPAAGFTLGNRLGVSSYNYYTDSDCYALNILSSASPMAVALTQAAVWAMGGIAFLETAPSTGNPAALLPAM